MPTKRPRHMITETEAVAAALEPLRRTGARIDLPSLLVRGAQAEMAEIENKRQDEARRAELRKRFIETTRDGETFDLDIVLEVRERAWKR